MIKYESSIGPFAHNDNTSVRIMYTVILTLLPAAIFGVYQFGLNSLMVLLVGMASAIAAEWGCLALMQKRALACMDGSAMLTGLLLAMSLPPTLPLWITAFGSVFAIVVGKHIYGGLGQNLFNPAMLARVMMIVCFPVEMTSWANPASIDFANNLVTVPDAWFQFDGVTSATSLSSERTQPIDLLNLLLGEQSGSLGETCSLFILAGGLFLIYRGLIHWAIPVSFLLGLAIPALISHAIAPELYLPVMTHVLSGGAMLGAFYIATDLVTSPTSIKGQLVYGAGCGLLIWLIRCFGSYPEGVAFAVLIMNSASPLIDHYLRPNIFGSRSAVGK
ncbi:RnfABCDGE type electron transport complex subunit D [Vibrio sp. WJH972]